MAQPVLVRSYSSPKPTPSGSPSGRSHVLPPISAFAFADILRAADGPEFQAAIDGIAEICAKNRMSLAEEYGSHLPPVGEITATPTDALPVRHPYGRPYMRRALTSVPEASSGSSGGSAKSKRRGLFGFGSRRQVSKSPMRMVRISPTGRSIPTCGTTAISATASENDAANPQASLSSSGHAAGFAVSPITAVSSLQHLIGPRAG